MLLKPMLQVISAKVHNTSLDKYIKMMVYFSIRILLKKRYKKFNKNISKIIGLNGTNRVLNTFL